MKDRATFHCAFSKGVSVTVNVDYDRLLNPTGAAEILEFTWHGRASHQIFPQYVAWMHGFMGQVAKHINKTILHAYMPAGNLCALFFRYHPDGTYQRVPPPSK